MSIEIEWVPRSLNEYADSLSRVIDFDDWSVSTDFFSHTFRLFSVLSQSLDSLPQINSVNSQVCKVLFQILASRCGRRGRFQC